MKSAHELVLDVARAHYKPGTGQDVVRLVWWAFGVARYNNPDHPELNDEYYAETIRHAALSVLGRAGGKKAAANRLNRVPPGKHTPKQKGILSRHKPLAPVLEGGWLFGELAQ